MIRDAIPVDAAKAIATAHGYDQVIVYARRVGTPGLEWVTTYGRNRTHCDAAARIGAAIGNGVVTPLEKLRTVLEKIAADERIYIGHGDYTEHPMSGADAQAIAREALV